MKLKLLFGVLLLFGMVTLAHAQDPLTQTYTASDNSLTFMYPESWVADDVQGFFHIATNSAETLALLQSDGDLENFPPDAAALYIFSRRANTLFGINNTMSLDDVIATLRESSEEGTTFGETESLTIADHPAQRFSVSDADADGFYVVVDFDTAYLVAIEITAPGQIANYDATLLSILNSVILLTAEEGATLSYTTDDGSMTFQYPSHWLPLEIFGALAVTNNTDSLSNEYTPGTATLAIQGPRLWALYQIERPITTEDLAAVFANVIIRGYDDDTITLGPVATTTVGSFPAARVNYSGDTVEGFVMAIDINGSQLTIHATTAPGELAQNEEIFAAIIASIQYDPTLVQLDGVYKEGLTFDTPVTDNLGADDSHLWTIDGSGLVAVTVSAIEPEDQTLSDFFITLHDAEGVSFKELEINTTDYVFMPPQMTIRIQSFSDMDYDYTITVTPITPSSLLAVGESVPGFLGDGDEALYTLTGTIGQPVSLSVTSDAVAPALWLIGPHGFERFQNTTLTVGSSLNTLLPYDGDYLIVLRHGDGNYTLTSSLLEPTPISIGQSLTADYTGSTLFYALTVEAGTTASVSIDAPDFGANLELFNANGQKLRITTDNTFTTSRQHFTYSFTTAGTYYISVGTSFDFRTGPFTLTVE